MLRLDGGFQRRRMPITPLIDIIFLLLLFFMLTSTFTRFAEVQLVQAGDTPDTQQEPSLKIFLRLTEHGLTVNGIPTDFASLAPTLLSIKTEPRALALLSLGEGVSAQLLVDALSRLRNLPGLAVVVLQ